MQPPNPNPSHIDPYSHLYAAPHFSYYSHLQPHNPNPNPHQPIDPQPGGVAYAHHQTVDTGSVAVPSVYYPDPNGGTAVQSWAANLYVTAGTRTAQVVPSIPNSTLWSNLSIRPHGNGTWKRGPKKTKIVQSVWCEVCKILCNSNDVLIRHKLGKKHKSNLEQLLGATVPVTAPAPAPAPAPVPVPVASTVLNPVIGPQENPAKGKSVIGQRKSKKAAESVETKRRKILEGGAAAGAVRTCTICNVVCNSETVFRFHLLGQKHLSMMKKRAS